MPVLMVYCQLRFPATTFYPSSLLSICPNQLRRLCNRMANILEMFASLRTSALGSLSFHTLPGFDTGSEDTTVWVMLLLGIECPDFFAIEHGAQHTGIV